MFKDKEEFELFNHINSHDPKTPIERALKLSEECGEVAEAMLSTFDVSGSEYKTADRFDVIEECVDVIIVAKSIIASVINANGTKDIRPELAMNVIGKVYDIKMDKWQEKCSVPPMEVDGSCIEPKKDETKVFSYKKFVEDKAVMVGTIKLRECLRGMDGFAVEKKAGANSWYTIECTGEDVHEDWIVDKADWVHHAEPKKKEPNVFSYKKFVGDKMVVPSTIESRESLKLMDGFIVEEVSKDWYRIIGTDEQVHDDWVVDRGEWISFAETIECAPKKKEHKVFCYRKYEEDVISNSYEYKKTLDGMIIHLEDGSTDILNVYPSGRDGVVTMYGKDMYIHEDWIVPESEFKFRIAADTLVVDIQKWVADMGIIDDDLYKLDGVEICRRDVGDWYIVKYEDREYNVHNDWLTPYGEFVKRKWGK